MLSRNTKYILMILVVIGFIGIGLVIEQSSAIGFSLLAYCLGLVIGLRSAVALISLNTGKTRSFPDVTLKKSGYAPDGPRTVSDVSCRRVLKRLSWRT